MQLADSNALFKFKNKMDSPESQKTLEDLKNECGGGPFFVRKVPPDQVVLLSIETEEPVYRNERGSTAINEGFVERCS